MMLNIENIVIFGFFAMSECSLILQKLYLGNTVVCGSLISLRGEMRGYGGI